MKVLWYLKIQYPSSDQQIYTFDMKNGIQEVI